MGLFDSLFRSTPKTVNDQANMILGRNTNEDIIPNITLPSEVETVVSDVESSLAGAGLEDVVSEVEAVVSDVEGAVAGTGFEDVVSEVEGALAGTGLEDVVSEVEAVVSDIESTLAGAGLEDVISQVEGAVSGTGLEDVVSEVETVVSEVESTLAGAGLEDVISQVEGAVSGTGFEDAEEIITITTDRADELVNNNLTHLESTLNGLENNNPEAVLSSLQNIGENTGGRTLALINGHDEEYDGIANVLLNNELIPDELETLVLDTLNQLTTTVQNDVGEPVSSSLKDLGLDVASLITDATSENIDIDSLISDIPEINSLGTKSSISLDNSLNPDVNNEITSGEERHSINSNLLGDSVNGLLSNANSLLDDIVKVDNEIL